MLAVEALDVSADLGCPIVDDTGVTTIASWLVTKLPGKYSRAAFVAVDQKLDVLLVDLLALLVCIP
jgi:hypothetical protein